MESPLEFQLDKNSLSFTDSIYCKDPSPERALVVPSMNLEEISLRVLHLRLMVSLICHCQKLNFSSQIHLCPPLFLFNQLIYY